jgi:uncharacterized protein YdhG (YjbR/CyaY superfamily)
MQSKATTVDLYLKEVPADRLSALTRLRELCVKELKGYSEVMMYGGPCYAKSKIPEVGFASQKHFIGLYILKTDVMEKYRSRLQVKGISIGKGCIRYSKPDKIDFDLVRKMLKDTVASTNIICG